MTSTMKKSPINEQNTESKSSARKRGLGRGLNALFGDEEEPFPSAQSQGTGPAGGNGRTALGVDQMAPSPFQPRQIMDDSALNELAESVATHGVLQPILVRKKPDSENEYEIIAGERRWRAAQKAGLHEVPVIIRALDNTQAMEIALIENLQRENLNALEEAEGYKRLLEEFGHTQAKLAAQLGKSRSHIANMVRLLSLPASVQALVKEEKLSAGHARALITAADPETLAGMIVEKGLSVREAEKLARGPKEKTGKAKPSTPGKDVDTLALEEALTNKLGMRVSIDMASHEKGRFVIAFRSLDQLDEILERF